MYVTIQEAKTQANIDYDADDTYIGELINAAEDYVSIYCNRPLEELCLPVEEPEEEAEASDDTEEETEEETRTLRPAVKHAVLLLVAHWYNSREAVSFATPSQLPFGVSCLLIPLKKYKRD